MQYPPSLIRYSYCVQLASLVDEWGDRVEISTEQVGRREFESLRRQLDARLAVAPLAHLNNASNHIINCEAITSVYRSSSLTYNKQ